MGVFGAILAIIGISPPGGGNADSLAGEVTVPKRQEAATVEQSASLPDEISVTDVKRLREAGKTFVLLDVREEEEWKIVHIKGAQLLPLSSFDPAKLDSVKKTDHIITYCHHGVRSLDALAKLQSAGFQKVQSMTGGIDVWAKTIEPGMTRY